MAHSSVESVNPAANPQGERMRLQGLQLWGVLIALMLTLLLAALDQTIVSTALPTIIRELHGVDQYAWVVTAYLLTETTVIPIVGKLSDQFGRKWFVITGVVIFLIGSALSGASQTMNQLILFRGLQGVGAGFIFSQIFTLVGDIFTPAERARWQGLFSGVFALASVIGPTLGGWITDNTSWRWVFYVNIPIGIVALALLFFRLPNNISIRSNQYTGREAFRRIDFAGALTAAGGTVCLLLGLTWGGVTYPWQSVQVIGILVAAVVLFGAFFYIERIAREPILPLDLFRNQVFAAGSVLSLLVGMALFAVVIYLPLFIQGVLGQSATSSGAVITPLTLTLAIGAIIVGQLIARIGRYQFLSILGALVLTFGVFLFTRMTIHTTLGEVTRDMIIVGLGMGMLQPVLTLAVQNAIPRNRLGVGTSAVTYLRTLGQTLGTALIGAVVNTTFNAELAKRLPAAASRLPVKALQAATNQEVLTSVDAQNQIKAAATHALPPDVAKQVSLLFDQIFLATKEALAIAIQHAFTAGLIICALVIVTTFFLKDVPLSSSRAPAPTTVPMEEGVPAAGTAAAAGAHALTTHEGAPGATLRRADEPPAIEGPALQG